MLSRFGRPYLFVGTRMLSSWVQRDAIPAKEFQKLLEKAQSSKEKADAVQKLMGTMKPGTPEFVRASKEIDRLERVAQAFRQRSEAKEMIELLESEGSSVSQEDVEYAKNLLSEAELDVVSFFLPTDPNANKNAILEVRPGVGGDEAGIFAYELFKMYERFAVAKGWKWETLLLRDQNDSLREGVALVSSNKYGSDGELGVYGLLQFESGVHRVQRVPATESQGRVHTSTAAVIILPEADEKDSEIKQSDLRIDTYRSSGPGGQHVNTTESAVRITHIPTGITVAIQDERSQHANRRKAMRILAARVQEKEEEERAKEAKSAKLQLVQTGDRSEKIRTYNNSRNQILDHRLGHSMYGIEEAFKGSLRLESEFMLKLCTAHSLHLEEIRE